MIWSVSISGSFYSPHVISGSLKGEGVAFAMESEDTSMKPIAPQYKHCPFDGIGIRQIKAKKRHFRPQQLPLMALLLAWCGGWTLAPNLAAAQDVEQGSPGMTMQRCLTIGDEAARLRCYEDQVVEAPTGDQRQSLAGGWRLLRTPNPRGGKDAVSVFKVAELSQSDVGLAGLMFRCGPSGIEALLVVITPFPPSAHPTVTIDLNGTKSRYDANVVSPGALLLLPAEVAAFAAGPWREARELAVTIEDPQHAIRGAVMLNGLGSALVVLRSNCIGP